MTFSKDRRQLETIEPPSPANHFLAKHTELLRRSYRHWTGTELCPPDWPAVTAAKWLYHAPFVLLSHDAQPEPVFNYANLAAQRLFEMNWAAFLTLPSRRSAEPDRRSERKALLDQVAAQGYISDYSGVRITATNKRFRIQSATVWNLIDKDGVLWGQAAMFEHWQWLDQERS